MTPLSLTDVMHFWVHLHLAGHVMHQSRDDNCLWHHFTSCILPGLAEGGCQGAGCISQEPLSGFCSFFAGQLIWQSRVDAQKFTTLGLISWILESFFITMATLSDFFKISNREDALWPSRPLPTKFRPGPSRNGAGRGGRCHKPYCFYCMMMCRWSFRMVFFNQNCSFQPIFGPPTWSPGVEKWILNVNSYKNIDGCLSGSENDNH